MSKSANEWRIELAQEIAALYSADVILVVGSVAQDFADAWSDLDMLMFWQQVPTEQVRRAIVQRMNPILEWHESNTSHDDPALHVRGDSMRLGEQYLKVDINHKGVDAMQKMIRDVTKDHDSHPTKLAEIAGFTTGIVLKGNAQAAEWHNALVPLPHEIIGSLLNRYLMTPTRPQLIETLLSRQDDLVARQLIDQWCDSLVKALLVLNQRYPPSRIKHLRLICETLTHRPDDFAERIASASNAPLDNALATITTLAEDLFSIIKQQGHDLTEAYARFKLTRPPNHNPFHLDLS